MSFVVSLLQAIVQVDGDAAVLHVGEKPYVVTPKGQVDLATRGLTLDAVRGIVGQLLPPESQQALDEFGAASHDLAGLAELPGERFSVVVARGGDDIWAEIRRHRVPEAKADTQVPAPVEESPTAPPVAAVPPAHTAMAWAESPSIDAPAAPPVMHVPEEMQPEMPPPSSEVSEASLPTEDGWGQVDEALEIPSSSQLWADERDEPDEAIYDMPDDVGSHAAQAFELTFTPPETSPSSSRSPAPPQSPAPLHAPPPPQPPVTLQVPPPPPSPVTFQAPPPPVPSRPVVVQPPALSAPSPIFDVPVTPQMGVAPPSFVSGPPPVATTWPTSASAESQWPTSASAESQPTPRAATPIAGVPPPRAATPIAGVPPPVISPPASPSAVVLPLARNPIRGEVPPPRADQTISSLDRLLRLAAARGASILYLSSSEPPAVRVDGEVRTLEGAPVLGPNDVESLLLTLMPERNAEALRTGIASEWICEIPELGRVRCMSFRDHRGPGGVFRMMPERGITAEQLGLSREIQSLAIEPEGVLLVSGPRSSGKRTLIAALVDVINRVRRDHVITIEREINAAHDRSGSFVSQREVRGGSDEVLAAARAALREDPDVLVIEDVRTAGLMNLALEAAASGQLVIGGFPAHSASGAIDRIIDLYPPEYRRQVQLSLAQNLCGVVAQVLLRKNGGGRVAARELLLNTPTVRGLLAEGRTSQLPLAIEGGRVHGMSPLNDALIGYVQSGTVDVAEAYRRATDRAGFLAVLKRQGVDTSAVERYA